MRPELCGRNDQGSILRRLFGARSEPGIPPPEASVVAVTSGKGGTGKSFVASSLAVLLARRSARATLVDCDFGLGNAHLLLGVNPTLTLQHVLSGRATIAQVHCPTCYGPGLVPGGSGISRMAELSERELLVLASAMRQLARARDVLVLDTAAGISAQSLLMLLASDHVVAVTNPEIAALTDAYALIKCLARLPDHPPISVVVNRAPSIRLARATFDKLRDVSRRFSGCEIQYLGAVPEDPAVAQRRLGQPPLVAADRQQETARCIEAIAERLERSAAGLGPKVRCAQDGVMGRFQRHLGARLRR